MRVSEISLPKVEPCNKVQPCERIELLLQHIELWEKQWSEVKSFDLMKKFFKMYISGWDGAAKLRAHLMEKKSADDVRAVLDILRLG